MRLHRFIGNFDFSNAELCISDVDLVSQIKNVLRLSVGHVLILSDGQGNEAEATIISLNKKEAVVNLTKKYKNENVPKKEVTLFCAILKKENFELVAQKATEIGVARIVPVISERTVKQNVDMKRVKKIIKEASEQSGRGAVPLLHDVLSFQEALSYAKTLGTSAIFDSSGEAMTSKLSPKCLFIGPEGGWSKTEIDMAKEKGLEVKSLGSLTLRAETAAIVASYVCVQ